ncbi:MAG: GatB/YqeY domain-containing protein [Gemmatimonadaceae bacterium]|nr:GatB/YqeY domain-containing protein [Gemmatimonadaceae bacterium]
MSSLLERVQAELSTARKAQDKPALLLLGTILSDLRNREIEQRRPMTDDDALEVIRRGIKKRKESVEMYAAGARHDLAEQERAEVALLERYLPAQVDSDEIRTAVRAAMAAGATTVGAIMGRVMPAFKGRADGAQITGIVREELASLG